MKKYLATVHTRSDRHKNLFAFGVSGGFTLLIFAIWMFVHFGPTEVVEVDARPQLAAVAETEVSPFESIGNSLSSIWGDLRGGFRGIGAAVKGLPRVFEDMKGETLDTYGR